MKLLNVIKVCLLIAVAVAARDARALERANNDQQPLPPMTMVKFVNEFPSMKFADGQCNWQRLSAGDKEKIKAAEENRNKSKSNLIFDIVRFLPSEVCMEIVKRFCGYDETKMVFVSGLSIKDFAKLAWAQEVYDGKRHEVFNKCIRQKSPYTRNGWSCPEPFDENVKPINIEIIFNCAKSIELADSLIKKVGVDNAAKYCLFLEDIKTLNNLFSQINPEKLRSYFNARNFVYRYTSESFSAAFNERFYRGGNSDIDMLCLKIFGTIMVPSFLARVIELTWCQKVLDPDIMGENMIASTLNKLINESKDAQLLSGCLKPIRDSMNYSYFDIYKMYLPCCLPYLITYQQNHYTGFGYAPFIVGLIGNMAAGLVKKMSDGMSNESMFISSAMCTFLMVGYVISATLIHIRKAKFGSIPWDKINKLLKKHDDGHIVIQ